MSVIPDIQRDMAPPRLPSQVPLNLMVRDPEVIMELCKREEGAERETYALEALRLGVMAVRQASGSLDATAVQREADRMLGAVDLLLTGSANELTGNIKKCLGDYFDPKTGNLTERLDRLVRKDGDLASLLSTHLAGDSSVLATTLVQHVGAQSPLLQMLSPTQKDGLLARLEWAVTAALKEQREKILNQFSLDDANSALSRLVNELTQTNGKLREGLAKDVNEVKREFSLDNEQSALSRLVSRVESTNTKVEQSLTLDREDSPLARLSRELKKIISDLSTESARFQTEVRTALESMQVRKEEAARGTQHGLAFEEEVGKVLQREAAQLNDLFEAVGNTGGRLGSQKKVGDHVLTLGAESAAPGARIVVECKEQQGYTETKARAELEEARKNRDAQIGIFVYSKSTAPAGARPFARYGPSDLLIVWNKEDPGTDVLLTAAVSVARALAVKQRATDDRSRADLKAIDAAVIAIEKYADKLEKIRTQANTIKNNGENIMTLAGDMLTDLRTQVTALRAHMDALKLEK